MNAPVFRPKSTSDIAMNEPTKVLLYTHHGFGKTYQCRNYQARFGKGLIISGEAGLKSLADTKIDYIPFSSWDGEHDPNRDIYSFKGIVAWVNSPEFAKLGYQWIAIDSLTELADRLNEHIEREFANSKNGFERWNEYSSKLIGALKWIRDLNLHVYVSCLAKEEQDANGVTHFWPMVKGQSVAKQIPAIFDHVLCGVRKSETDQSGVPRVTRYIVTEEIAGWHGKVRDPRGRVRPWMKCNDITSLLHLMTMPDDEYARLQSEPINKEQSQ